MKALKVLLVEDTQQNAALVLKELRQAGYAPVHKLVNSASEMSSALEKEHWDIIISAFLLSNFSSSEALSFLSHKNITVPLIVISGQTEEATIVEAMKAGAFDYILKENLKRLLPAVEQAMTEVKDRHNIKRIDIMRLAREKESQRTHIKHLTLLNRISESLSEAKDFDALLRRALDGVIRTLRSSAGVLLFRDQTNGDFRPVAEHEVSFELVEIVNKMLARINTGQNGQDKIPAGYWKHWQDHTAIINAQKMGFPSEQISFVVSVPIKAGGKTIAIIISPSNYKKTLSKEEKLLLDTMGSQMGAAIENAWLLQNMSYLSITDELTKLYNRRHFYEVLETEMGRARRYSRPLSLALLDIDRFKEINDQFGHTTGDGVLKSLATVMAANLRKTDTIFRYGGDEFALIFPETNSNKAREVIERIRLKWLFTPKTDLVLENPLGFSAGIAEVAKNGDGSDGLMFLVDAALYNAKRKGGNRSTLVSEMEEIPHDILAGASPSQIYALAATVDIKEAHGYGHSIRVANIAEAIGKNLGLSVEQLADLRGAALLHDIGKIGIPGKLLNKSDKFTPLEWDIIKMHPQEGAKIVSQIKKICNLAPLIRHHHECYDGSGYPDGLKGREIPLGARIICIADAYDTMVTPRSYGIIKSPKEALTELERCAGTQFDPEIIKIVTIADLSQR
jgi:diguanylate cyclase (GGDEF)-like protein/putative nucleotidyltransferase with HDIG domain